VQRNSRTRFKLLAVAVLSAATLPVSLLGAGKSLFIEPRTYQVSNSPYGLAAGDFNGDGKPDLAVGSVVDNVVEVLINKGDGTFEAAVSYTVGLEPLSVAVGDFNRDGNLDLVVCDGAGNKVSILLGNGDGTFRKAVDYGAGIGPSDVVVGDFNGDGKLDLAVSDQTSSKVSILLGNGDGTFQPTVGYATIPGPLSLGLGDLNGDGSLDLVMVGQGGNRRWKAPALPDWAPKNIGVLLGNGDGTFRQGEQRSVGQDADSLILADLNGDGKLDLAVADYDQGVFVLLGNGNGTFGEAIGHKVEGHPLWLVAGDFNRDGNLDLATANDQDDAGILLGRGDGSFEPTTYFDTGTLPAAVVAASFTSDGALDLAVTNAGVTGGQGYVSILAGYGNGRFSAPLGIDVGSNPAVATADFNADGRQDIVAANAFTNDVVVLLGNGDGTFESAMHNAIIFPTFVAVGDFNGDGYPDLAVTSGTGFSTYVNILLGKGDGTFQAPVNYPVEETPTAIAVADFNGDGDQDLAVAIDNCFFFPCPDGLVSIFPGNGAGGFREPTNFGSGGVAPVAISTADFNNDGYPDLAVVNFFSANVGTLLGKGNGSFELAGTSPTGAFPLRLAAADLTGDGYTDLAVTNSCVTCQLTELVGNGRGLFRGHTLNFGDLLTSSGVAAADFSNDGRQDLAFADPAEDTVALLLNLGGGIFGVPKDSFAGHAPGSLAVADFNGDGAPDIVVGDSDGSNLSILLNSGAGTAATRSNP
jgi:hypothetical protein